MPCRPFGLLDGMILVGGVAVGIVAGREVVAPDLASDDWRNGLHVIVGFALIQASCLMLAFRLRRPRPPIRRVADQPGFVACFAMVVFAVAFLAGRFADDVGLGRTEGRTFAEAWGLLAIRLSANVVVSWSVAVGWGLLILGRRWRAEPGWIDGFGRVVGYAWIGWALLGWSLRMIDFCFPAPNPFGASVAPSPM